MRVLRDVVIAVSSVFGCRHDRLSRPFTIQRQSYMVCLECGLKVHYSMEKMRRLSKREVRHLLAAKARQIAAAGPLPAGEPTIAA